MIPIDTSIDSVTVYTDRARIARRGKARVGAGPQELVVEDLPIELLPESVRAAATATAPARILGTEVTRRFHVAAVEGRVADLQAQLEALGDQLEALNKQAEALAVRRTFLQTLAGSAGEQLARGIAFGRAEVETGAALATFLAGQLSSLDAEMLEISRQRRELGKELAARKAELDSLQRARPTERQRITVLVELEAEGELELEVSYQVTGASWQPLYDLRLLENGAGPKISLSYMAQVTQRTGEAWSGVSLTLSTAKPALGTIPPELPPWYLQGYNPQQMLARRRSAPAAAPMAAAYAPAAPAGAVDEDAELAGEAAPQQIEAVEAVAEIQDSGGAVSFHAPGRPDIPSDGSPHRVALASHDLPARLDYVTAPKLVSQAYRRARILNTTGAVLLPGPAAIFIGSEFIGATGLKNVAPDQEFEVFLGVDDRIRVERKLVGGAVDRKLLTDVRRMNYAYEVRVTNLKTREETVTVLDQVPVSRHESVKVRPGESRPPANGQSELGRLTWELQLAPGQERTIRFGFTIESPREMELVGLPPLREETG